MGRIRKREIKQGMTLVILMEQNNGWIKLHRKMLDNPVVMKDPDHIAVWIYLLLNATHDVYPALFNGKRIELQAGQLITGRKSIAEAVHVDEYKVYRILQLLKNEHQIAQQASNKNSLITIVNWHEYQDFAQQDEQQLHNNCTTTAQQLHTNKNDKNVNNDKNERKNSVSDPFLKFKDSEPDLFKALKDYESMRKSMKKPMTDRSKDMLLTKLKEFPEDHWIPMIEEAINHNWLSVYQLKEHSSGFNKPSNKMKHVQTQEEKDEFNAMLLDFMKDQVV